MELKLLNIDLNVVPSEESNAKDGDLQGKNEDVNVHFEDNMVNDNIMHQVEVHDNVNINMPMNYETRPGLQIHGEGSSSANPHANGTYWMPRMVMPNPVMMNGSAYVNNWWGYVYRPQPTPPQTLMHVFSINNNNTSGYNSYLQTPPMPLIGTNTSSPSAAAPPATAATNGISKPPSRGCSSSKKRRPVTHGGRTCTLCKVTSTKMWRRGPVQEPLCNKCGLRISRASKKALWILPKKRATKTPNASQNLMK